MLDLGQRANELFKTSDNLHKQQILKGLVYNVEMFDQKLSYTLINCYEALRDINLKANNDINDDNWYYACDSLIRSAIQYEDNTNLQELASTFSLNGSLLAV